MSSRPRDYRDPAIHETLTYPSLSSLTGRHRIVRELVRPEPTDRVLEVGCTTGYFVNLYLRYRVASVDAVDIDAGDVRRAEREARATPTPVMPRYRVASAEALPYADESFSLLYCMDVLEHVDNPLLAAREIARVTAPNGRVVITVPGHWFGNRLDRHYPEHRHYRRQDIESMFPSLTRVTWHQTGLLWSAVWSVLGGIGRRASKLVGGRGMSAVSHVADVMGDLDLRLHYGIGSALTVVFRKNLD